MSGSLENRSSLRKLEFPACTLEALDRLLSSFSVGSPGLKGGLLSPKETELVLEIIDEFVFFTKSSKSKRLTQIQELQLMQVIVDFFQARWPSASDDLFSSPEALALGHMFAYLFMDPPSSKGDEEKVFYRLKSLVKLTSVAVGLKSRPVLHCLGVWLHKQGPTSEKATSVCDAFLREFVLLVDDPWEAMKHLPALSPLFAAHVMTALTGIYSFEVTDDAPKNYSSAIIVTADQASNLPPTAVVNIINGWMTGGEEPSRLVPALTPVLNSSAGLGASAAHQALTPLVGLAKWSILHPLVSSKLGLGKKQREGYALLHVSLLECLSEVERHRHLIRNDALPSKAVSRLITQVQTQMTTVKNNDPEAVNESLDRLGQFICCLMATDMLHGKKDEIFISLKQLPARNSLIDMLIAGIK